MKIRALGALTGHSGDRAKGEEFVVDREYGAGLIARGYAEEVVEPAAERPARPVKADSAQE